MHMLSIYLSIYPFVHLLSSGRLAQSVKHRNGNPRVSGSSSGMAVHVSNPVTFGGQCVGLKNMYESQLTLQASITTAADDNFDFF